MTYPEAKEILRDALVAPDGRDFTSRLVASPGRLSVIDASTSGELPPGDAYGDRILRSLLVVWRHIAGQSAVERELMGILLELAAPIGVLGADTRYADTRIPQISLTLDAISMSCLAQDGTTNGIQPRSETKQTSSAADTRR